MNYCNRGKINKFDSYMAGFCPWITPRQILIIADMCEKYKDDIAEGVDREAFLDFKTQIDAEAAIKRKRYLEES